jgi:uncharacterized Zn-binding protein involved in type VI secretion
MPLICTVGHQCTGHDGFHPRPIVAGESNYTLHGQDIAVVGSPLASHSKPKNPPHGGAVSSGSPGYTIRGKPIARIGSAISCGSSMSEGVSNYDIP